MEEKLKLSMDQAVVQTFGEMAFVDVMPVDEGVVEHHQIMVLDITKPQRGTMYMLMTLESKQMVVENIHGDSWNALSPSQIDDCLLELLNVLGGSFLCFYFGENVNYSLSFPQVVFDDSEIPDLSEFKMLSYDAEGAIFSIALKIEATRSN